MIRQVQYFHSIVEHGSFTRAAEDCFISQSAISQQLKSLEDSLGFALLKRQGRSFELTEAGSYFYEQTRHMIEQFDRICKMAARIARYESASFRIGYLRTYQGDHFARAIASLLADHPDLKVEIVTGSHEQLFHMMDDGSLDLAFSDQRRAFSDAYHNEILLQTKAGVLINARHPLAFHESLSGEDLASLPCIVVVAQEEQESEMAFYRDIYGIRSPFLFASSMEEARVLVIAGQGFMVLDDSQSHDAPNFLLATCLLTRQEKPVFRNVCLFWHNEAEGYFHEAFAEKLRETTSSRIEAEQKPAQ